ncbi:MAG: hypothetical protein ABSB58_08085 [Gemmatimonadales bacterium]
MRPAAERRSSTADWQLIFGFRPTGEQGSGRTRWALHHFTGHDKARLFVRAELVTDDELAALLESVLPPHGG